MKALLLVAILMLRVGSVIGQVPVIDFSVLAQAIEDVRVATEQLQMLKTELERIGDPARVKLDSARDLIASLRITGVGHSLEELRNMAEGSAALSYDGNGLYRPPGEILIRADGSQITRDIQQYRKFDAITQAKKALEDVMRDTAERRQHLRQQIQVTVEQLVHATTLSEVQKLSGVLTAQHAEIGAIDREREAALSRVLVQHIENSADAQKQTLAQREERSEAFRVASGKLSELLTPNTTPVRIPDPRTSLPLK